MRHNKDMNDEKRMSILHEYLHSPMLKTPFEKEKGLKKGCISRWLSIFALEDKPTYVRVAMPIGTIPTETNSDPQDEIKRLKRQLREKELELKQVTMARDVYEKMIEIAETKYAIPIRKNSGAK